MEADLKLEKIEFKESIIKRGIYIPPDELVDCHKCSDGQELVDDDYNTVKAIICSFCQGHKKVYFTHSRYWHYDRAEHPLPNEYTEREIVIFNNKMTIGTTIRKDVEFHERKGLSKKEALDKIQKEFNNEKRELLELEKRILYRDMIKEMIREHEAELAHGPQASFKDMIMSKERKNYSANPEIIVSKCDACNGAGTVPDEEDEVEICDDCLGTGYVDERANAVSIRYMDFD